MSPGLLRVLRTGTAVIALGVLIVFGTLGYNLSPTYYWCMLVTVIPAAVYGHLRQALALADARVRAERQWMADPSGIERARHTQLETLQQNYSDRTQDESRGFVDDRTWFDLGMDEIRNQVDVCFTISGRNELFRILRHSLPPLTEVEDRLAHSAAFREDQSYREKISHILSSIGEERDADPATLLWSDAVKPDRLYPLFVTMALLAGTSIAVTAALDLVAGLICVLGVFFTNMWIYYRKARHISGYVPALRILSRMIDASAKLPDMNHLRKPVSGARGAFAWLLTGAPSPMPGAGGDILEMVFLYIKIFFQIDLIAHERIVKHIVANRGAYRDLYQAVGSLDAAFSLASYRARRGSTCDAVWTSADAGEHCALEMDEVYHPLVEDVVPNSVMLHRPGAIITGTNMAGKSTFLRTIGINVLLAQSAGFAFARRYVASRMRVLSSIDKSDNLAEGKSFYYDEAERIYRMIKNVDPDAVAGADRRSGGKTPALLLIDELLSGTNSLERESASVAILDYLSEHNALTIAATHDVSIAKEVGDRYERYFFTDSADENGLSFTYEIQKGVVTTRNAIKLLRLIGYPEDVISAALKRTGSEGE